MSLKIKAHIEGIEKVQAILKGLPPQIARRVLRPALTAEGSKVVTQGKRLVPQATGLLKKSLGKKTKTYTGSGTVIVVVGPRSGFKTVIAGKKHDPTKYAHLVEFGAKPHSIVSRFGGRKVYGRKKRNYTTVMHPGAPAQHSLSKAYKYGLVGAAERMTQRMAIEIEKQAAKGAFKKGK